VSRSAAEWALIDFGERIDSWVLAETPTDSVRLIVTAWVMTRFDDPYQGMRRQPGFDNLWFGVVPGTYDGRGKVVCCSYWILEATTPFAATSSPPSACRSDGHRGEPGPVRSLPSGAREC
jgi:hypothetical protein